MRIKFNKQFLMKTIKVITKFECVANGNTDRIDNDCLVVSLGRVNTDDGFTIDEVPFCFNGFRVQNKTPKLFLVWLFKN